MKQKINLTEFLRLFRCSTINDCWLNNHCEINENGIKAKVDANIEAKKTDDIIELAMYHQKLRLDFPCTDQQLFYWAQGLDNWEMNHLADIKNQNHVIEKLPKDIVDKWQPVNELFSNWSFEQGNIKAKIGKEPFDVSWNYWLSLPKWTKNEAALLISGLEPDKFYLIEKDADYQGMCVSLFKLLRQIPDELTQCPLDWLGWFAEVGYLQYASIRVLAWLNEAKQSDLEPQAELEENYNAVGLVNKKVYEQRKESFENWLEGRVEGIASKDVETKKRAIKTFLDGYVSVKTIFTEVKEARKNDINKNITGKGKGKLLWDISFENTFNTKDFWQRYCAEIDYRRKE